MNGKSSSPHSSLHNTPRSTLEFLPDPLWLLDANGRVTYANPAAGTFAGTTPDDLLGQGVRDALPFARDTDLLRAVERASSGEVVDGEVTLAVGRDVAYRAFPHEGGAGLHVRDVTRERRDTETSRTDEALFRTLFEASPRVVLMLAPDARVLRANERWQAYTGERLELGGDWTAVVHDEDREALRARVRTHVAEGSPLVAEVRVKGRDGEARWHLLHMNPVRHEEHVGWVLSMNDVHEQKLAEARSTMLLSELEARVASRTAELGAHARALEAFATFTEAAGGELDEGVLARRAIDVLQDTLGSNVDLCYYVLDDRSGGWRATALSQGFSEADAARLREGPAFEASTLANVARIRRPAFFTNLAAANESEHARSAINDSPFPAPTYHTVAFYPFVSNGEARSMIALGDKGGRAWTDRDRAVLGAVGRSLALALERAELGRRLEEQRDELSARNRALTAFSDLARELSLEGDDLALIRRALDLVMALLPPGAGLYYELDEDTWRLKAQHGSLRDDTLQAAVDAGLPKRAMPNLTGPFETGVPDYQTLYDREDDLGNNANHIGGIANVPLLVAGKARGIFGVALFGRHEWTPPERALLETAVSSLGLALERSSAVREVQDKQAALVAANRDLEAFAYSISHDLRAPLRHISAFVGLLRRAVTVDEKSGRYLDIIESATTRMNALIDDLLSFSRLGRGDLKRTNVDLGVLLDTVRAELAADLGERRVRWNVASLPTVRADPTLLHTVLTNLLSNALKYTRGRGEAVIDVWAEDRGAEDVIFVRDNGAGFNPKYRHKLFGVFQRLHSAEEFEGNGIGLANVKRAVARLGGEVDATSVDGAGATFSFSLPKGG
ncbi:PAS domain S-box protein [Deinococcus yavapaiensis]|uniref:histidine kinase n=1 Tax=Deinococcus yavapaiensis KR-236 TaxID=694435 RepID=A0A318SCI2_9DEIO|nr:PAS domain S-box protein [Deinococcus yavapaiensis]PYE56313.1 PAS domain S-box-containing protein [Deinococcus yavapaiensis KR-236]